MASGENRGNRLAEFEAAVDAHGSMVLRLAARMLGNSSDAEDVHQEVFLALWRVWGNPSMPSALSSYLYRATVRECVRRMTKQSRRSVHGEPGVESVAGKTGDPVEEAASRELEERFRSALVKLPEREAMAFALRRLQGLSYAEVSQALSCSQETARVYVHRAAVRLSELLSEHLTWRGGAADSEEGE